MAGHIRLQPFNRTMIPDVVLPENYQKKLPEFYSRQYDQEIKKLAEEIGQTLDNLAIELEWNKEKGLVSIDLQPGNAVSCYLEGSEFQPHNIDTPRQALAITAVLAEYLYYLGQVE